MGTCFTALPGRAGERCELGSLHCRSEIEAIHRAAALEEVDAVGFNRVFGPHHLLEYIRELGRGGVTLPVRPNAGYPTALGLSIEGGSQRAAGHRGPHPLGGPG